MTASTTEAAVPKRRKARTEGAVVAPKAKRKARTKTFDRSTLYAFLPEDGFVEFPVVKANGSQVWANDPKGRFRLSGLELAHEKVVVESEGAFFGLDASYVLQAARNHYAPELAQSRNVLRLLSAGEQHIARMGRPANCRGGRRPAGPRHQRQVVLDDETLAIWETFSGDRSKSIRHLLRTHGLPHLED